MVMDAAAQARALDQWMPEAQRVLRDVMMDPGVRAAMVRHGKRRALGAGLEEYGDAAWVRPSAGNALELADELADGLVYLCAALRAWRQAGVTARESSSLLVDLLRSV